MSEKLSRQQIYDRIRTTSKDSYILEEMRRLGFWESSNAFSLPDTLIQREAVLTQELNQLLAQDRKYSNAETMLKEMRKARMKAAKEKREQTKQHNKEKKQAKATMWVHTQSQQIIFLGKGVSAGLNNTISNTEQLDQFNLPVFQNVLDLATKMQMDLKALRYLLYQRKVSKINHYHVFDLPKKSGGKRRISAPKKRLKQLQNRVLETILHNIKINDTAHGFIKQRSIITNATPHLNKDIVINMDLKDFFPSIHYGRVKGLFHKLGYSEQLATILALICTQADTEEVEMDGAKYYVQKGHRFLPQGSPASPAISNLMAYRLDKKIQGLAAKLNFTYTRYADDLSFSCDKENDSNVSKLLFFVKKIVISEGFELHPDKTHIMRKGDRQQVTGIVVNKKLNIERQQLHKFRAVLHNIEKNGWKEQQWGKAKHLINALEGYIHYIKMVHPEKGKRFKVQLDKIIALHGYPQMESNTIEQEQPAAAPLETIAIPAASNNPKQVDWWDIF